jgi:hypothetical protein
MNDVHGILDSILYSAKSLRNMLIGSSFCQAERSGNSRKSGVGHGSRGDGHSNFDVFLSGKVTGANCELYAERRVGESA